MICGERLAREGPELLLVISTHGWRKASKTVGDKRIIASEILTWRDRLHPAADHLNMQKRLLL